MKKVIFGLWVSCLVFMTSCLEGGSNVQTGSVLGVIEYVSKEGKTLINIGAVYFYDADILSDMSLMPGDCITFRYTLDYDSPENKQNKGYYTVTSGGDYRVIDSYSVEPYLRDTTVFEANEIPVSSIDSHSTWGKISDYLFLPTYHTGVMTDERYSLHMSYDQQLPSTVVNGDNVYDLYIRVYRTSEGKSPLTNTVLTNAFNIKNFFSTTTQKEKAAGNKNFGFRINYIKNFDDDKTVATWAATDIAPCTVSEEN